MRLKDEFGADPLDANLAMKLSKIHIRFLFCCLAIDNGCSFSPTKGRPMKRTLVFSILLTLALPALADVREEVLSLNENIRHTVKSNHLDERILLRLKNQLETALRTLQGERPGRPGGPGRRDQFELRCMSRDNDNRAPYILAGEFRDFSVKRFPDFLFQSENACMTTIQNVYEIIGGQHFCVSKDKDGKAPYVLGSIIGQESVLHKEVFLNLESCNMSLQSARSTFVAFSYCSSRDRDGRNPYIRVVVDREGKSSRQSEIFNSLESCLQK